MNFADFPAWADKLGQKPRDPKTLLTAGLVVQDWVSQGIPAEQAEKAFAEAPEADRELSLASFQAKHYSPFQMDRADALILNTAMDNSAEEVERLNNVMTGAPEVVRRKPGRPPKVQP